ncbi:MAG TPA: DNA primase, partial [Flavobacterium sp.]|nr:DNA primase [Flavobacterium sp.]
MGYIKREFIDKILDIAVIQDVIGDFVELKRSGANLKGKSPFVDEKTASFIVSPVKQIWKDFSSGKGGNVVNFLMQVKHFTYPEAIEYLAQKYKEPVQYDNSEQATKKVAEISKKQEIRPVLEATLIQYQKQFSLLDDDHPAKKEVFTKREYSLDDVVEWGIGYAPENFLYDLLKNSGRVTEGLALGLLGNGQNNAYDVYTNRVVYPIHDKNGLLIGLAGRDISDTKKYSKWINPKVDADNILYDKSKVWYGLHKARTEIRKRNEVFIVEGYNDVIAMHKYGCINTIAPCGTAITEQQMNELKKLCDKVVFVMDPDNAGKRSVIKYSETFLKLGFRVESITLDYDPDDFSRVYKELICLSGGLQEMFNHDIRIDAFKLLMEDKLQGSDIDKLKGAEYLSELIAQISDNAMIE